MNKLKGELDGLFGDTRIADLEAAISESVDSATSFGWPGWSMPKWSFTRSGVKQSTSDVVTLIGSYLNPPVSVVGAPTGKYYSARKYTYWVVLTLLAVALGYGLFMIVSRWRARPTLQAPAAVPKENAFALPVMDANDNTKVDWPATLEKANATYRATVAETHVETVVSYRVHMFAAYFVAADDSSDRAGVIAALTKQYALDDSIGVPWTDSPSTLSACLGGAIRDLPAAATQSALLKSLIESWNVGEDAGANVHLSVEGNAALGAFEAQLTSLDPATRGRIGLLETVPTAFGRKNAKGRENRNASLAKRATQCQFLVPCGSNLASKLCRCENNTVSAYDYVPLCSEHAAKTSDMAAFRASMVELRSKAGGVAGADIAINAAMDEIRGAAMWGKGQLDAKGTESELTPGFADLPKFGTVWIPGSQTFVNAARSGFNYVTGGGSTAAQLAPEIETSTELVRANGLYRTSGALPQAPVKAHARRAGAAQSPPELETITALVRTQPSTSSVSESPESGMVSGPQQQLVTTRGSRRVARGDAIDTGGDWAPVYVPKLRRDAPSVSIPRGLQSEQYRNEVREAAAKVYAAFVKEESKRRGQALITNGTDADRRAVAAEAIDKEMSPRGSTGSVMRLLGHTTKGSSERNDTALTETELRKLATGLVTRRAHKTKNNNFDSLVIGLANIETVDRTIAGIDAAIALTDRGVCYISSTAVYQILTRCVGLADSDVANANGLDAVIARGKESIVIGAVGDFEGALKAVDANDHTEFRRSVTRLIAVFKRADSQSTRSAESEKCARLISNALKLLLTCVILQSPVESAPDTVEAISATIFDVRSIVAVEAQKLSIRKTLETTIEPDAGIIAGMIEGMVASGSTAAQAAQPEFGMQGLRSVYNSVASGVTSAYNSASGVLDSAANAATALAEITDWSDAVRACAKAVEEKLMFLVELIFGLFSLLGSGTLSKEARAAFAALKISGLSTQEREDMKAGYIAMVPLEAAAKADSASRFGMQGTEVPRTAGGDNKKKVPAYVGSALAGMWDIKNLFIDLLKRVIDKLRAPGSILDVFGEIITDLITQLGEWTKTKAGDPPEEGQKEYKARTLARVFGKRGPLAVDLLKRCRNWWYSTGGILALLKDPAGLVTLGANHVKVVQKYARAVRIALVVLLGARLVQIMTVFAPQSGIDSPLSPLGQVWGEMTSALGGLLKAKG